MDQWFIFTDFQSAIDMTADNGKAIFCTLPTPHEQVSLDKECSLVVPDLSQAVTSFMRKSLEDIQLFLYNMQNGCIAEVCDVLCPCTLHFRTSQVTNNHIYIKKNQQKLYNIVTINALYFAVKQLKMTEIIVFIICCIWMIQIFHNKTLPDLQRRFSWSAGIEVQSGWAVTLYTSSGAGSDPLSYWRPNSEC